MNILNESEVVCSFETFVARRVFYRCEFKLERFKDVGSFEANG